METCEVCQRKRLAWFMAHSDGCVSLDGVTTLQLREHTVCSDECANVLYFCAIFGYSLQDYLWLL